MQKILLDSIWICIFDGATLFTDPKLSSVVALRVNLSCWVSQFTTFQNPNQNKLSLTKSFWFQNWFKKSSNERPKTSKTSLLHALSRRYVGEKSANHSKSLSSIILILGFITLQVYSTLGISIVRSNAAKVQNTALVAYLELPAR